MSWATKRKLIYLLSIMAALILLVAIPGYKVFYRPPSCTDRIQNQGELGIDCGGPCALLCKQAIKKPIVEWQRFFEVTPGFYTVLAYIQNPNLNYRSSQAQYVFRLYDEKNLVVAERKGMLSSILPNKATPVFEQNIDTSKNKVARVSFEFTRDPQWFNSEAEYPLVLVDSIELSREDSKPKLEARINNASFVDLKNFPVVAILYDVDGNAVATSRTVVDLLEKNSDQKVVFTWQRPFGKVVSQKTILPIIDPLR